VKSEIHPKYFSNAVITCSCGEKWNVGSTRPELSVELCSKCHPFFTGEQRIVDTEGRVERFKRRFKLDE
jgi:large subunit ribosomal protein L31